MRTDRLCLTVFENEMPEVHLTSKEGFLAVLRRLADGAPASFLPDLAVAVAKDRRNHLARRLEDVYPLERSWDDQVVELVPGWHVGLNCNDAQKSDLLEAACRLRGKSFGPKAGVWVRWAKELREARERRISQVRD